MYYIQKSCIIISVVYEILCLPEQFVPPKQQQSALPQIQISAVEHIPVALTMCHELIIQNSHQALLLCLTENIIWLIVEAPIYQRDYKSLF